MANKYLFANLFLFASGEGDEATSLSFTTSYASIQASSSSLETLISAWYVQWGWKSEYFTNGKQMPICQSFTFCEWRGRRGNVALFYNTLCSNESSNASMEALTASLLPACGPAKEATFPTAIRLLITVRLLVACADGEWGTTPSCVSMGACNVLLQVRIHLSMHVTRIPNIGNTHLPRRTTSPLWRPPSGHFFPSLHLNYPSQSSYIWVVVPFWFRSNSILFPGSPSCSSPSTHGSPFISPGPRARRTHLPPPDAPTVAHRAWTKSRSFTTPHVHLY